VAPRKSEAAYLRSAGLPTHLVDRDLPWITRDQLAAAQRAATETARRFTAEGTPGWYIRSLFLPEEARCLSLLEVDDARERGASMTPPRFLSPAAVKRWS
jgi:hypothetical protein